MTAEHETRRSPDGGRRFAPLDQKVPDYDACAEMRLRPDMAHADTYDDAPKPPSGPPAGSDVALVAVALVVLGATFAAGYATGAGWWR